MEFNSFLFIVFLIIVVILNYISPTRYRASLLLISSFIFIAYYSLASIVAVLFFSIFNFYVAKKSSENKFLFFAALMLNISSIILFSLFHSLLQGLNFELTMVNFNTHGFIVLLGLSFYSLQNIAYISDVYFKRIEPETSILNYVLYSSFFPKAISGPIMLSNEFIPQINGSKPSAKMLASGINRFLIGLLKKMVIADRLFPSVHAIFDSSTNYSGLTTVIGIYLFTIQLYFDFSGYTDMALGIGKMLGYELKENFNLPLRATSIADFWRRWHISLISWFSNYIYYPVVYHLRAYKKNAVFIGIATTFLASALWHGIGLTFLFWALCYIVYMSFEVLTKSARTSLFKHLSPLFYKPFAVFIVFNAVCFSNIFFRAASVTRSFQLMKNIFSDFIPESWLNGLVAPLALGGNLLEQFNFFVTLILTSIVLLFERAINKKSMEEKIDVFYITLCVLLILIFGMFTNTERFIYMQF